MKRIFVLWSLSLFFLNGYAQESNNGKQMFAKSYLNQKAPELVIKKWISDTPDTKGKFVIIDFWETYCHPCFKAMHELNGYAKKFEKELVIIGLSRTKEAQIPRVKAMKRPAIEYYYGTDTTGSMAKTMGIKAIPYCLLIDPTGIVRWEGYPLQEDHKLTEGVIENLLKKYGNNAEKD